jgi:hypothetical protein
MSLYERALQFKREIAHLFERMPADAPRNREEYLEMLKKPIRSLSELNVGDIYMVRVRGSAILQSAKLDEIVITATNGVSFVFSRESNLTFINKNGKPNRIPESVHQEDVWLYYTADQQAALLADYDHINSGYNTPATGAQTPNSINVTMTPSQRSGVSTPNSKDATMTPSTRSGTATPVTARTGTSTPKSQLGVPLIIERYVDADSITPPAARRFI